MAAEPISLDLDLICAWAAGKRLQAPGRRCRQPAKPCVASHPFVCPRARPELPTQAQRLRGIPLLLSYRRTVGSPVSQRRCRR